MGIKEKIDSASDETLMFAGLVPTLAVSVGGGFLVAKGLEAVVEYSLDHPTIGSLALAAVEVTAILCTASRVSKGSSGNA